MPARASTKASVRAPTKSSSRTATCDRTSCHSGSSARRREGSTSCTTLTLRILAAPRLPAKHRPEALRTFQRELILARLERHGARAAAARESLGLSKTTFHRYMKELGITAGGGGGAEDGS